MKLLLLLPLLLGLMSPAIAHNEANGGAGSHSEEPAMNDENDTRSSLFN